MPTATEAALDDSLNPYQRFAHSLNQESLKLLMDLMLQSGAEKVSAMGGHAINALQTKKAGWRSISASGLRR